jgi:hypothetical protein
LLNKEGDSMGSISETKSIANSHIDFMTTSFGPKMCNKKNKNNNTNLYMATFNEFTKTRRAFTLDDRIILIKLVRLKVKYYSCRNPKMATDRLLNSIPIAVTKNVNS